MRAPEAPIGWPSATAPPLHVDLLRVELEQLIVGDGDDGERLVDLVEVDVAARELGLRERAIDRHRRRRREPLGRLRRLRHGANLRQRLPAARLRHVGAAHDDAPRAPSLIVDALPAVTVPSFWNAGFSDGIFSMSPRAGPSSAVDLLRRALALRHLDGDDLVLERARLLRRQRALERLDGVGVLRRAIDLLLARAQLGRRAHVEVVVHVPQAVVDHAVDDGLRCPCACRCAPSAGSTARSTSTPCRPRRPRRPRRP